MAIRRWSIMHRRTALARSSHTLLPDQIIVVESTFHCDCHKVCSLQSRRNLVALARDNDLAYALFLKGMDMPRTTPFYECLAPLNQTGIWKNWSGYLVAPSYQYSLASEYYAIRNAVAAFDTSPLFKYRIGGDDAEALLAKVLARDIRQCDVGKAQYTCWCDDDGYVLQDGVVMRVDADSYWLTAAEPILRYLRNHAREMGLRKIWVDDVTNDYGILALQGPHSHNVASQICGDVSKLDYFDVMRAKSGNAEMIVSRTGFTGDLGYEFWIPAKKATSVYEAITEAGAGYNLIPIGSTALKMSRVEAGLLLIDVDFHNAKHAWVAAQKETPIELGWSWMFRGLAKDERNFVGRAAIETELRNKCSRWKTVGLSVDWHEFERVHAEAGVPAPKHEHYHEGTMSIYRRNDKLWDYAGYATSFIFSSLLKRPIAIAKLPPELTKPGTEVDLEVPVIKKPVNVLARVSKMPFFNPSRKNANVERRDAGAI